MFLFSLGKDGTLKEVNQRPFRKERDLQSLCEKNIRQIFDLEFVRSEFSLENFRLDTLAFDAANKAFVVIEYKRDKSFSVVDQGYAYLSLMLNNKADFILEYNENCDANLRRQDVDWSQSRVIFVSPSFTEYQRQSINFKDLPIELWEVRAYNNGTVFFIPQTPANPTESIKTVSARAESEDMVKREIRVYTEADHLVNVSEDIQDLYETFKSAILSNFEGLHIAPKKVWISFVLGKRIVCDMNIGKKFLKMWINLPAGSLDDPKALTRDVSKTGHWGNGDYEVKVSDDADLEYILSLLKQSYVKVR